MARPTHIGNTTYGFGRVVVGVGSDPDAPTGDAPTPVDAVPESSVEIPAAAIAEYYPPLGSETTDADAIVYYWRAGMSPPTTPTPGWPGDWHFQGLQVASGSSVNPAGWYDRSFGVLGNALRLIIPGPTVILVHTLDYEANGATVSVVDVGTSTTLASGPSGTPLEVTLTAALTVMDVGATDATGFDGVTVGSGGLFWIAAPFVKDGDDATSEYVAEESATEAGAVLRLDVGTAQRFASMRLVIETGDAGSVEYALEGANESDFSDAVELTSVTFTASGGA